MIIYACISQINMISRFNNKKNNKLEKSLISCNCLCLLKLYILVYKYFFNKQKYCLILRIKNSGSIVLQFLNCHFYMIALFTMLRGMQSLLPQMSCIQVLHLLRFIQIKFVMIHEIQWFVSNLSLLRNLIRENEHEKYFRSQN